MDVGGLSPRSLKDLASELGLSFEGDGQTLITGVAALESAGPSELAFVRSKRFADLALTSGAGVLILPEGVKGASSSFIRSENPALDFARAVALLVQRVSPEPGQSENFFLGKTAHVDPTCIVADGVSVGAGSHVGARTELHPGVIVYPNVSIGEDCVVHAGCILREGTWVGDRVTLQPGVVIGGDGFGYVADHLGMPHHIPHVGNVRIESDVEIGSLSTVDRGTLGDTRIRQGAKIDNQVQIAHNCDIGERVIIAAQCGLSGSTRIESGAVLMGGVGSAGHLTVGAGAFIGAGTGLHKDVEAGTRAYGFPQQGERSWHRTVAALSRLPDWLRRLRALEKAVAHGTEKESSDSRTRTDGSD